MAPHRHCNSLGLLTIILLWQHINGQTMTNPGAFTGIFYYSSFVLIKNTVCVFMCVFAHLCLCMRARVPAHVLDVSFNMNMYATRT